MTDFCKRLKILYDHAMTTESADLRGEFAQLCDLLQSVNPDVFEPRRKFVEAYGVRANDGTVSPAQREAKPKRPDAMCSKRSRDLDHLHRIISTAEQLKDAVDESKPPDWIVSKEHLAESEHQLTVYNQRIDALEHLANIVRQFLDDKDDVNAYDLYNALMQVEKYPLNTKENK